LIIQVEQLQSFVADGGFTPAAAQLKPPLVAFGIWKVGKDGAAGIDGVEATALDVDSPLVFGAGLSQAAHFEASALLEIMQMLQVQDPALAEGGFAPAAAQLNPALGTLGIWDVGKLGADFKPLSLPLGAGDSQAAHFDASDLLEIMQVPQVQESTAAAGGLVPAAAQLNVALGGSGAVKSELDSVGFDFGLGASHAAHLIALSVLEIMQVPQVQVPALAV